MTNRFNKYLKYLRTKDGQIIDVNKDAFKPELIKESFLLFKELYNTHYGSINEDKNLISIHTGGWSENESLISEFKETVWWNIYYKITSTGGHYYFNLDNLGDKEWRVININNE